MGGTHSMHGTDAMCIQNLGQKIQGKRPLEKSQQWLDDNIIMDLKKMDQIQQLRIGYNHGHLWMWYWTITFH